MKRLFLYTDFRLFPLSHPEFISGSSLIIENYLSTSLVINSFLRASLRILIIFSFP